MLRLKAQGSTNAGSPGKAIIMVYLNGGPSHTDMYDLKPQAPAEYRGEYQPIQTNVPGFDICEARMDPCRARPVPFCFQGFWLPPETKLRVLVMLVP